jgi:hypothetical protein
MFAGFLPTWMVTYEFIIAMIVLLLALVGVLLFLRSRRPEEDD